MSQFWPWSGHLPASLQHIDISSSCHQRWVTPPSHPAPTPVLYCTTQYCWMRNFVVWGQRNIVAVSGPYYPLYVFILGAVSKSKYYVEKLSWLLTLWLMQLQCSSSAAPVFVVTTITVWPHLVCNVSLVTTHSPHSHHSSLLTPNSFLWETMRPPAFLPCLTEIFLYFLDKIEEDKGLVRYIC